MKTAQKDTTPDAQKVSAPAEEVKELEKEITEEKAPVNDAIEKPEVSAEDTKDTVVDAETAKPVQAVQDKEEETQEAVEKEVNEPEVKEDSAQMPEEEKSSSSEEKNKETSKAVPSVDIDTPLKVESENEDGEEPVIEKKNKKLFMLGIVVLIVVVVVTGGFSLYLLGQKPKDTKDVTVSETKEETTPTPTKELVREDWTFEVLNGSGVAGAAKKASDELVSLGYKVDKTGNADNQDYEKTQLFFKKDASSEDTSLILDDLKETFPSIEIASDFLEDEASATARIIIGSD